MEMECQKEELRKEELQMLRNALDQLLYFIRHAKWKDEPYFYRPLDHMKNNIEIYFYTQSRENRQLYALLFRDWKAANNQYTGIPSCELMTEQENVQRLNRRYLELLGEVAQYF